MNSINNSTDLYNFLQNKPNKTDYIIDIGASWGNENDPVYDFIKNNEYKGLCIEGNTRSAEILKQNISSSFSIYNGYITPENIIEIFEKYNVPPSPDILKIDIDGYDLEVIRTILKKYRPSIIIAEINEKIPPPVLFEVLYKRDYNWDGSHCFGFSISSGEKVMNENKYKILNIYDLNNIVCIDYDLCDVMGINKNSNIDEIYKKDYILQDRRFHVLHWNQNINYWLDITDVQLLKNEIKTYYETNNDRSSFQIKTKIHNKDFALE